MSKQDRNKNNPRKATCVAAAALMMALAAPAAIAQQYEEYTDSDGIVRLDLSRPIPGTAPGDAQRLPSNDIVSRTIRDTLTADNVRRAVDAGVRDTIPNDDDPRWNTERFYGNNGLAQAYGRRDDDGDIGSFGAALVGRVIFREVFDRRETEYQRAIENERTVCQGLQRAQERSDRLNEGRLINIPGYCARYRR